MPVNSVWPAAADPFLSLESLDDADAIAWVEQQNARTRAAVSSVQPLQNTMIS